MTIEKPKEVLTHMASDMEVAAESLASTPLDKLTDTEKQKLGPLVNEIKALAKQVQATADALGPNVKDAGPADTGEARPPTVVQCSGVISKALEDVRALEVKELPINAKLKKIEQRIVSLQNDIAMSVGRGKF